MCVSAGVSAGFATGELAALGLMLWRGGRLDRAFALAVAPIAMQEALQVVLWRHVATTPDDCDAVNHLVTLLAKAAVNLVPIGFCLLAALASKARGAWVLLGVAGLYQLLRWPVMIWRYLDGWALCTHVGPNHHQVWGSLLPEMPTLPSLALYAGPPMLAIALYLRPARLAAELLLVSCGSMALTLVLLPVEFESVWCWVCSALLLVGLFDPAVRARPDARVVNDAVSGAWAGGASGTRPPSA